MSGVSPMKRKRESPNRKWSVEEETAIASFIKENIPFEKPTAHQYYKKCTEQLQLNCNWSCLRNKVRNMRTSFSKVRGWEKSTGAGVLEEGETIRDVLQRKCHFYDYFEEVFGNTHRSTPAMFISEDTLREASNESHNDSNYSLESPILILSNSNSTPSQFSEVQTNAGRRGIYSRTAVSEILKSQENFLQFKKSQMEMEREFKERDAAANEKELDIQERKLQLEDKKKVANMSGVSPMKRKRESPNRKWSVEGETAIASFIKENIPFEKPTAHQYYKKCTEQLQLNCNWSCLRNKVRNMRTSFSKVQAWEKSTGAGVLEEGETIRDVLQRKCHFYDYFEEVFGNTHRSTPAMFINEDILQEASNESHNDSNYSLESPILILSNSNSTPSQFSEVQTNAGRRGIYSRTAVSEILKSQENFLQFKKSQMEMEREFKERDAAAKEKELDIQERKLQLEDKKKVANMSGVSPMKRKRESPNRKWSVKEETAIASFIKENIPFEKPTAHQYYNKCTEQLQLNCNWSCLRNKVRNMRTSFSKVRGWEKSTGAGVLEEGETIRDVLQRKCHFYDYFEEVFGSTHRSTPAMFISEDTLQEASNESHNDSNYSLEFPILILSNSNSTPSQFSEVQTNAGRRGIYSRTAVSEILKSQENFLQFKKSKMEMEREFKERDAAAKEKELDIQERKLQLEDKKKVANMSGVSRMKRKRESPNRKWSVEEETAIASFIKENIPFEKPTAHQYYKKCTEQLQLNCNWSCLRNKVRNMRTSFSKVQAWEKSTGAGVLEEGETIRDVLQRKCHFYDYFEEVFGNTHRSTPAMFISEDTLQAASNESHNDSNYSLESPILILSNSNSTPSQFSEVQTNAGRRGIYSRTAVSEILKSQENFLQFKKSQMEMEREFKERDAAAKEKELDIQERKLQLEDKKIEADLEIRREELKLKEFIAMKVLEMRERLAILELQNKK